MVFGKKLKEARNKAGLSQVKMSEALGVPRRTYENWEMGTRTPAEYTKESILKKMEDLAMKKEAMYYVGFSHDGSMRNMSVSAFESIEAAQEWIDSMDEATRRYNVQALTLDAVTALLGADFVIKQVAQAKGDRVIYRCDKQ